MDSLRRQAVGDKWKRYAHYEFDGSGMLFDKKGRATEADLSFLDHTTGETVTFFVTPEFLWTSTLCGEFPRPWDRLRFIGRLPITKKRRGVLRVERSV